MIVRKAKPIPAECVIRGYLSGSGWTEYREKGTVAGIKLPGSLQNRKAGGAYFYAHHQGRRGTRPAALPGGLAGSDRSATGRGNHAFESRYLQEGRSARRGKRHPHRGYEV